MAPMQHDKTSVFFLIFILANLCAFTVVIGFFTGTSQMRNGIAPCLEKMQADADKCVVPRFWVESPDLQACILELEEYSVGNYDGHWSQVFLVPLIGAVVNIIIMGGFWYLRNVAQMSIRETFFGKKAKNMSPEAQKGCAGYPTGMEGVPPESIGSQSPPESYGEGVSPQALSPEQGAPQQQEPPANFA